jgi:hypothetical protein
MQRLTRGPAVRAQGQTLVASGQCHLAAPDTEAWLAAEVDGWSKGEVPERVTAQRATE